VNDSHEHNDEPDVEGHRLSVDSVDTVDEPDVEGHMFDSVDTVDMND
jgi:hypothetical protein